ncbi:hypothetical protein FRC09_013329, partial [Ceratobasidium sp. 395]
MSTLPLSPTRSRIESPKTPGEGVSAPLLAPGSSNFGGQASPDLSTPPSTSPLSCAPSSLPFRAAPPTYSPAAYVPRHGFAGARESSSGYVSPAPSSIRTTFRKAPQAAFLLPPETDSFVSHRTFETSTFGAYNLGGVNSSGQVPEMLGHRGLIDPSTPASAYTRKSLVDGQSYNLVFSDEFNVEGRSFYPGDDPYWEAVDLHYWATGNLEWYDPSHVTTEGGSLKITLSTQRAHGMNYTGGMISTWNKFCFTGGYIE